MTPLEFYHDLCRGKGSCFYAVQTAPERYRNMLTYGTTRCTAFDTQCEGTRAAYIYELLEATDDAASYLSAAIASFKEASPLVRKKSALPDPTEDDEEPNFARNLNPTDDDFHFLAELLAIFAQNGDHTAFSALVGEYDAIFRHLREKTERPDLFFPERDDFERLAILLATSSLADPLLVLRDVGNLFLNPIYEHYDFDILHELVGIPNREKLKAQKDDPAVERYLAIYYPAFSKSKSEGECRHEEEFEDLIAEYLPALPTDGVTPDHRADSRDFKNADPHPLMAVVEKGEDPDAVEDALLALSKIRHPDLHDWVLELLNTDPARYLPILMKNYDKNQNDAFEIWYELERIPIDPDNESGWHGVHIALLHMEKDGFTPPETALLHIYHQTLCSSCRLNAIKQLHRARALTAEILTEALHDANTDTRDFIRSLLAE